MQIALYVLLVFLLAVLVLNFLAPRSYHICRSIVVDRSSDEIFPFLKCLENQELWSPWADKDPHMVKEFHGTDGEVGAVSIWKGNKEVGEGEQKITRIIDGELMETRLKFFKPFRSESDAYIKVDRVDEGMSEVTWGFSGEHKFPMRIFMLFMNMEKHLGQDFEYGLRKLKLHLEKQKV